jgi:aurora kinase
MMSTPQCHRTFGTEVDTNIRTTPSTTSTLKKATTPKGVLTSSSIRKKRTTSTPMSIAATVTSTDERHAKFQAVCNTRVSEFDDDDDDGDGIFQEWSVHDFNYVRDLGEGGQATVFLAREKQSGYLVALKVQEEDDDAICEIDIHDPLDHPAIVTMIDYFFSEEPFRADHHHDHHHDKSAPSPSTLLFIILEYCDGGSLFDIIRDAHDGFLTENQAVSYFKNAVQGMAYLHQQEIIHCDVKSMNFLVGNNKKQLKLTDFGMAVRNDEREVIGGSPVYMSPEHLMAWRHMTDDFDNKSDVYSLGVILFEMLLGYLPYEVLSNEEGGDGEGDSLLANFDNLNMDDNDDDPFQPPILDLRKLDDQLDDEPFYIPPPIFPDNISEEAQNLILRLMEPCPHKRISLSEALGHSWFQKYDM